MSDESKGTVIVTGGSRGIGAAICQQLAADGFTVIVNYNSSSDRADAVVKAIQANGGTAHAVQGDVSSEAGVMAMFERVDRLRLPPLTALVNNAGPHLTRNSMQLTRSTHRHHREGARYTGGWHRGELQKANGLQSTGSTRLLP